MNERHSYAPKGERLTAVLPTYNGVSFLPAALKSLQQQTHPLSDIIVVDNNSTDGTRACVAEHCPDATIIGLSQNRGFGAACNIGVERALQNGADYVLLVNQDLIADPNACAELVRLTSSQRGFGWISALQLSYDGQQLDRLFRQYPGEEFFADLYFGRLRDLYEVEFAPAAFAIAPRAIWHDVGGFDPLFFLYGEDNDLCRRIQQAGWKLGIAPNAVVRHWHGLAKKKRTLRSLCILEYSQAVLHVKSSRQPVCLAILSYLWYFRPLLELRSILAKAYAVAHLTMNLRRIARHRAAKPHSFSCPLPDDNGRTSTLLPESERIHAG